MITLMTELAIEPVYATGALRTGIALRTDHDTSITGTEIPRFARLKRDGLEISLRSAIVILERERNRRGVGVIDNNVANRALRIERWRSNDGNFRRIVEVTAGLAFDERSSVVIGPMRGKYRLGSRNRPRQQRDNRFGDGIKN